MDRLARARAANRAANRAAYGSVGLGVGAVGGIVGSDVGGLVGFVVGAVGCLIVIVVGIIAVQNRGRLLDLVMRIRPALTTKASPETAAKAFVDRPDARVAVDAFEE